MNKKTKELRKQKGISQEQLAEKIYVSRQAITKWESGNGIPDIENLLAISALFNESIDSLLSEEKSLISKHEFLYESRTEYDLDNPKKIDLKIGVAHEVIIEKTKDEKIQVIAASNKLSYLAQQVKVKIVEDKMILTIKDDGIVFDPTQYHEEEKVFSTNGILLVQKIVDKISYARVLNTNNTSIEIYLKGAA